jgi:hypothetical protein
MKHLFVLIVVAILAVLCVAGSVAQETHTLVYRFLPGTTYLYADTAWSNQTQEMMGQEMKITSITTKRARVVGEKVNADGAMVLVSSLDSMTASTKSPMKDTTMVITDLLGKRMRLTVGSDGTVFRREPIDSIKFTTVMGRAMPMREAIRFHRMSKNPVGVGSTWKSDVVDSADVMGGKLVSHIKMDYAVAGNSVRQGRSCLQVGFKGEIGMEGKGSMMGMELFMEGKGKTSGTFFRRLQVPIRR